jgi:predicted nucleic acid-binding Zn finger protein
VSRTAAAAVCPCFLSIPYYHLRSTFCNLSLHVKASFEMDHIMSLSVAQVADLFFGADAYPHDYLHEVLFRLLAVGWIGAATQNLVNKVCMTGTIVAVVPKHNLGSQL